MLKFYLHTGDGFTRTKYVFADHSKKKLYNVTQNGVEMRWEYRDIERFIAREKWKEVTLAAIRQKLNEQIED